MGDFIIPYRRGLVAEYLLNGDTKDTSGNGYDGTASNVTYSKTDRGYQTYGGNFNGSSSKVDLPTLSSFSDFSICLVFTSNSVSTLQTIARVAPTTNNANIDIYIESGKLKFHTYNGSDVNQIDIDGTLSNGKTYFVCAKKYGTYGELNVFSSDGSFSETKTGTLHNMTFGTDYSCIGYYRQANLFNVNGSIQSVRIFNRALSENEIRNWYLESLRALGGSTLAGLMDGVVAYYDMRGDANDIVGGYDGTVNGATLTTDRFGNANSAYSFNGSSHIGIASSSALQLVSNYTIIADVEAGTNPGTDTCIVGKDSNTGERAYYLASNAFPVGGSNKFTFYINGAGGGYVNSTTTITTGDKYVVAGTHTGSQLKIYVNGTYEASSSASSTNTGNSELQIGARQYSGARQFYNGKIYRVLIFNVLKTDAQIATITKLLQNGILLPFA